MPDLSAKAKAGSPGLAGRLTVHGTPGSIWPADAQAGDTQRLHHRPRGLAAGNHQPPHAVPDEAARNRGERFLDDSAGALTAEAALRLLLPSRPAPSR